ncbi:hypothetical protein QCA50_020164 [Cerrena zonata]|uniref:Cytochrome P450 n=1 Tax=Cerrena zonata TaxID=2478898 RepID=A0AAW0FH52_9APHY
MELILAFPVLCFSVLLLQWLRRVLNARSRLPLPPGPRGYPLIGNLLDIPKVMPWKAFGEWSKVYGDVLYLNIPTQPVLVLNSAQAVLDLLEKRSEIYSDRPPVVMDELIGLEWNFVVMGYTQKWRTHRREFHHYFHQRRIIEYHPIILQECRSFLRRALEDPAQLASHLRLTYASTILKITYDMDVDINSDYLYLVEKALECISPTRVPGAFWVEFLPFLKHVPSWVPGAYFKRHAERGKPLIKRMRDDAFDGVKARMAAGKARASIASDLIERLSGGKSLKVEDEELARNITGIAYAGKSVSMTVIRLILNVFSISLAAVDTTTYSAKAFLLGVSLYPEVKRKAQAELDRVVGPNRLPDFSDYDNLIYIQAIALESIRWMIIFPLGVSHRLICDDEYRGFFIPKGTTVIPNLWSILHNSEDYPEPMQFNPDRFIKNGRLDPDVRNPLTFTFGFGRRICPGRWLSSASIFMTIASVLHTMDVHAPTLDSESIDLFAVKTEGILMNLADIPFTLTARSKAAGKLIGDSALFS